MDIILTKLQTLEQDELNRVKDILNNLNAPLPKKRFETEDIDPTWSMQKQSELEYNFYTESALRNIGDIGDIESIKCKSQLCRVKVQIPSNIELKPFHYMDWSNLVSVDISQTENIRTIEIYIAR